MPIQAPPYAQNYPPMDPRFMGMPEAPTLNKPGAITQLRLLLLTLICLLVVEGLARKAFSSIGLLIFFLKDITTLVIWLRMLGLKRPPAVDFLWKAYMLVMCLFLPLIFSTALYDPVLAVFGAKQYLLYPIVAIAVYTAYHDSTDKVLLNFYRLLGLLLIPTTLLAVYESRLPASHWLNLSVAGESLAGFSASGELRVSSSFSFVAQYCTFLNAEMFITIIAVSHLEGFKRWWKFIYLSLIPFLVLGSYITGSRGAVVGNLTIIVLGCGLSLTKFEGKTAFRIFTVLFAVGLSVLVLPILFPNAFMVYSSRESGQLIGYSGEVQDRVFGSLFGWSDQLFNAPFFGYGLGVMSNGSSNFSDYAGSFRNTGMWTETDFATSIFEGGFYLIVVWYGLRYYVIFQTTRRFMRDVSGDITLPAAFCQGFIIIAGVIGTLGIQPPTAIWFWFAVGSLLVFWTRSIQARESGMGMQGMPPPEHLFAAGPPGPPRAKRVRGRSVYAERLHQDP